MKKSEIFAIVLNNVVIETEVSANLILSSNRQAEIVDARYILVKVLSDCGFYPIDIVNRTGLSYRTINHILCNFNDRLNLNIYFRNNYARILNLVRNNAFN